jgi:hypothetical protein
MRPSEEWVTNDHWDFINQCWNRVPHERPSAEEVVIYVQLRHSDTKGQHGTNVSQASAMGKKPVVSNDRTTSLNELSSPIAVHHSPMLSNSSDLPPCLGITSGDVGETVSVVSINANSNVQVRDFCFFPSISSHLSTFVEFVELPGCTWTL